MQLVVRRKVALVAGIAVLIFQAASLAAATTTNIAGLFVTGAGGIAGLPDLHYQLMSEPTGSPTNAMVTSAISSSWMTAPGGSSWLSPYTTADQLAPVGAYSYQLTFDLVDSGGHALDPTTASIALEFASDDFVEIYLNNTLITAQPDTTALTGFGQLFSLVMDSGFVTGTNTLTFDVCNLGCSPSPTGLLVADICSSAELMPVDVPEPGTWEIFGLGFAMLSVACFFNRRSRVPAPAPVRIVPRPSRRV